MNISVRPLTNPPITEMALSVTLEVPAMSESAVDALVVQLDSGFQRFGTIQSGLIGYNAKTDETHCAEPRQWIGSRYRKDGNVYVSIHNVSTNAVVFACSLLRPYESWEVFTQVALPYMRKVCVSIEPTKCHRFGVRTVNRLLPPPSDGKIPLRNVIKNVSHGITGIGEPDICEFFHRDTLHLPDYEDLYVTIIRTTQPQQGGKCPAVILDTDVYAYGDVVLANPEFDSLLQKVHMVRNKVFFDSIGDVCLEGCR